MSSQGAPRLDGCVFMLVVVESLLYGLYLAFLCRAVEVLLERRRWHIGRGNSLILFTACFLFSAITAHWAIYVSWAYEAFILARDHTQSGLSGLDSVTQFLENVATPKHIAISTLIVTISLTQDLFMTYRLLVVWDGNPWITVLPILMDTGLLVSGSVNIWLVSSRSNHSTLFTGTHWIAIGSIFEFLSNISFTSLVAYKVWRSKRRLAQVGLVSNRARVLQAIIQSAALHSAATITFLVLQLCDSNLQLVLLALNCPLVGIVFCMIISRLPRHQGCRFTAASRRIVDHDKMQMHLVETKIIIEVDGDGNNGLKPSPGSNAGHNSSAV